METRTYATEYILGWPDPEQNLVIILYSALNALVSLQEMIY